MQGIKNIKVIPSLLAAIPDCYFKKLTGMQEMEGIKDFKNFYPLYPLYPLNPCLIFCLHDGWKQTFIN
jgi:hypothetical protein